MTPAPALDLTTSLRGDLLNLHMKEQLVGRRWDGTCGFLHGYIRQSHGRRLFMLLPSTQECGEEPPRVPVSQCRFTTLMSVPTTKCPRTPFWYYGMALVRM